MYKLLFLLIAAASLAAAGELTVTVPFDGGEVALSAEGIYTAVTVDGLPFIMEEGAPCLPMIPVRVALPTGCAATGLEVIDADYTVLTGGYDVMPASEPVPLSVEMDYQQAAPDMHIYRRDTFYPSTAAALHGSSVWWGIPMAHVIVNPVRWNPASRQLAVLSSISFRVTYEQDSAASLISRRTAASEQMAMEIAERLVANPDDVSPSGAALVSERDLEYGEYIIITHPDFLTQAQELADWKTAKGIPAVVYTTTWVQTNYPGLADLQQSMRAFLTDCRDEGADWVLIFGDDDKVMCRDAELVGSASYTDIAPVDLYFSDINDTAPGADLWNSNGNGVWGELPYPYQYPQPAGYDQVDYHPDLWVGRASVSSAAEADIFVDKVFTYEGVSTTDYFETAPRELRIGYSTGVLWYSPYISGSSDAEAISAYVPSAAWEEEKLYEEYGTNSSEMTQLMINAGPNHVFHASHGAETYMWTSQGSDYTVAQIMAQTNISSGGLPALWQSISCEIGHLDGVECCADAWLASPNGGGFGCFNSRSGFGNFAGPCTGPSEMLCIRFYYDHWITDLYNLGIAHATSMDYFVPPCSTYMDWCMKEYNLFGDPELPIWTEVPGDLSVTHPASISFASTVNITVTDGRGPVEGARVCLQKGDWQTGDIYEVAFTDASGLADIYVNPATTGTMNITVWARNFDTYQGSISVDGVGIGDGPSVIPANLPAAVAPSPAFSSTVVSFGTAFSGAVSLDVYDLTGRRVATLLSADLEAGAHSLVWDLTDSRGSSVPAGVYHIRLTAPGFSGVTPVMVLR
jgi:hypothetical protein